MYSYIHKPWYQMWHHACYYLKHKVNNEVVDMYLYLYIKHVGLFIILFWQVVHMTLETPGLRTLNRTAQA